MESTLPTIPNETTDPQDQFDFYFDPFSLNFPTIVDFSLIPEDYGILNKSSSPTVEPSKGLNLFPLLSPSTRTSSLEAESKKILKGPLKNNKEMKSNKKSSSKSSRRRRTAWNLLEDDQLLHLFSVYGPKWAKIASEMEDRTRKQVRDRYLNVLVENINKDPWTEEEDKVILEMFRGYGPIWCRISEALKGRTEMQVKNRYYTNLKKK